MIAENEKVAYVWSPKDTEESILTFYQCSLLKGKKFEKGFPDENHFHSQKLDIVLFLKGSGIYRIAGTDYCISEGDIFLIGKKEVHSITEVTDDMEIISISFAPRFVWSGSTDYEESLYLAVLSGFGNELPRKYSTDLEVSARICSVVELMKAECEHRDSDFASMMKALLIMLLIGIYRYEKNRRNKITMKASEHDYYAIGMSMDYINENLNEQITLAKIAEVANLSPNYYCKVFKKLNGETPWEYVTSRRIEQVVRKLPDYEGNILDLALSCGFNNTANFNRAFKICTGVTPREYRKRMKKVPGERVERYL